VIYKIKGWDNFQHFKDRRPPWIKLYRNLLDDMDWHELDGDSAKALVSLWLIASENEGQLPDMRKLAFRLRMSEKAITAICNSLSHWLERVDDNAISPCHQDDAPETETETETEKNMSGPSAPDGFEEFWKAYPRTPNMSKSAALKSWQKVKATLPPKDQLLVSVAKYRAFLAAETKKNGRDYPAKHAQGWLTERRWEGFMPVETTKETDPIAGPDWADAYPAWLKFKLSLPAAAWSTWFGNCHPNGSPSTLIAPSSFVRDQIESRYGKTLDTIFNGEFQVKTENHP